jgi:hypothetical protein
MSKKDEAETLVFSAHCLSLIVMLQGDADAVGGRLFGIGKLTGSPTNISYCRGNTACCEAAGWTVWPDGNSGERLGRARINLL